MERNKWKKKEILFIAIVITISNEACIIKYKCEKEE